MQEIQIDRFIADLVEPSIQRGRVDDQLIDACRETNRIAQKLQKLRFLKPDDAIAANLSRFKLNRHLRFIDNFYRFNDYPLTIPGTLKFVGWTIDEFSYLADFHRKGNERKFALPDERASKESIAKLVNSPVYKEAIWRLSAFCHSDYSSNKGIRNSVRSIQYCLSSTENPRDAELNESDLNSAFTELKKRIFKVESNCKKTGLGSSVDILCHRVNYSKP